MVHGLSGAGHSDSSCILQSLYAWRNPVSTCEGIVRLVADLQSAPESMRYSLPPPTATTAYKGHRFPQEIISHATWLYFRFSLSYRDVEELLAERGIIVTYETVRQWCLKFGQQYANQAWCYGGYCHINSRRDHACVETRKRVAYCKLSHHLYAVG